MPLNFTLSLHKKSSNQVKSNKAQIYTKFYKIPVINFEDMQLTSFFGIIIFPVVVQPIESEIVTDFWSPSDCPAAPRCFPIP